VPVKAIQTLSAMADLSFNLL